MLLLIRFATTAGRIGGFVVPGLLTGLAAVEIAVLWLLCIRQAFSSLSIMRKYRPLDTFINCLRGASFFYRHMIVTYHDEYIPYAL